MARKYKLTLDMILEAAAADDNTGFCLACGAMADSVEPDAREYECDECGKEKVYGAAELLIMYA